MYLNILDLFVKGWNEEETFAFIEKSCYTSKTKSLFYTYKIVIFALFWMTNLHTNLLHLWPSDIRTFLSENFALIVRKTWLVLGFEV